MRELVCLTREPFVRVSDMDADGDTKEGPHPTLRRHRRVGPVQHQERGLGEFPYTFEQTKYMHDIQTHLSFPSKYAMSASFIGS